MVFTLIGDSTMNNLVWVFFSMAGISTPTPCQSALHDPLQTLTAIDKQERLDKPGACARDMRAREVALRNVQRSIIQHLYIHSHRGTKYWDHRASACA
jgi:hypothetical protein